MASMMEQTGNDRSSSSRVGPVSSGEGVADDKKQTQIKSHTTARHLQHSHNHASDEALSSPRHSRNHSTNAIPPVTPYRERLLPRRATSFPLPKGSSSPSSPTAAAEIEVDSLLTNRPEVPIVHGNGNSTRRVSVGAKSKLRVLRRNNNAIEKGIDSRPPPAMITQGKLQIDTTSDWVASQQTVSSPLTSRSQPPPSPAQPTSARSFGSSGSRPLIKPIRGFKPSSYKGTDMALRQPSADADSTLRAIDAYERPRGVSNSSEQDEPLSDESDLFLRAAREEDTSRQAGNDGREDSLSSRLDQRSRIGQRSSLPPSNTLFQSSLSRRRGSDNESSVSRTLDDQGNRSINQALTYNPPERDRASTALDNVNRSRFYGSNLNSSPTTPRANREFLQESGYQGRRGSLPDPSPVLPSRPSSYRQSNLSYSTPRNYNSSPLVSRTVDMQEAHVPETSRAAEGTESTASTTAPSTVWDELEDLKSRIHRLELTGKLPATSGAAMSRAAHERPPTATTTTNTTMSTSPKQRGNGKSSSPTELSNRQAQPNDSHPLLYSALAKSQSLLTPEIFAYLEAAANDALDISAMMGESGQPGPISSAQSTVDGPASGVVSDRQVRRKAGNLCRSLTELCLALSNEKMEQHPVEKQNGVRPRSSGRDSELRPSIETSNLVPRQPLSNEITRIKSSPRALSRLEERRSSLLNTSSLPSPRFAPSEVGNSAQSTIGGRRTSLLIRSRRGNTEEPEEDTTRFRAPSRAITEVGRFRNSQREYVPEESLPERSPAALSSLPVRRNGHVSTSSLPNTGPPVAQSTIGAARRFLDRSTPERDTAGPSGRLTDNREMRKSSITGFGLGRTGSLTRRRQANAADSPSAGTGYQ
ncbi:hypothetical protein GLAREA_11878 [Glarea lozoyensis ATCC 20868]|uniref:Uncharacterized protein n=1 Tax=Glarea lozoyensis (strain ATCC 20868 / MF5171) TaxID=1116229 RepID=S3DIG7_GLAL2|nr:uncharacterized protein GLAREA_11878 [Glarea lozoyensis ATCC 20868]EPE31796.1 hypothetical protein GLAREA_11878 [Glarea lozoyensis ATCC 20868]